MKKSGVFKKFLAIIMVACIAMSILSASVSATRECGEGEIELDGETYYARTCIDNANRSNFIGTIMAGRSASGIKRFTNGSVLGQGINRRRVKLDTKDWATGNTIAALSGVSTSNTSGLVLQSYYSKAISVFATLEAWYSDGSYTVVYPTIIGW